MITPQKMELVFVIIFMLRMSQCYIKLRENQDLLQSSNVFNIGTNQSYLCRGHQKFFNCPNTSIEYRVGQEDWYV